MSDVIYMLNGKQVSKDEFVASYKSDDDLSYNFWKIPDLNNEAWGKLFFGNKAERAEADKITRGVA